MSTTTSTLTTTNADVTPILVNLADSVTSMTPDGVNVTSYGQLSNSGETRDQFESPEKSVDSHFGVPPTGEVSNTAEDSLKRSIASKSIRVHLVIKSNDIGFEGLHSAILSLDDDVARIKHVKRVLIMLALGHSAAANPLITKGAAQAALKSFPITFRLSHRDIGLEKLYVELLSIEGARHRNHQVKRWLFNAYSNATQASTKSPVDLLVPPIDTAQSPTPSSTKTLGESISPWSSAERQVEPQALTPEQLAERRVKKRKKTISGLN